MPKAFLLTNRRFLIEKKKQKSHLNELNTVKVKKSFTKRDFTENAFTRSQQATVILKENELSGRVDDFRDYSKIFFINKELASNEKLIHSKENCCHENLNNDTATDLSIKNVQISNESTSMTTHQYHNYDQMLSPKHNFVNDLGDFTRRDEIITFHHQDSVRTQEYGIDMSPDVKKVNTSPIRAEMETSPYNRYSEFHTETRPEFSPISKCNVDCSDHFSLLYELMNSSPSKLESYPDDQYRNGFSAKRFLNFDQPTYSPNIEPVLQRNVPGNETDNCDASENYACEECGKRYSTSSNLARHRQIHRSATDRKARKCPHCEKVYVSMPAFSMHVRTHSQGCECLYCGKRFSRPWLLQGHIRTHTGEKPFDCPKCGKCFADKSNLRAHVQTHSTEKPYICGRCGKAFALKSYLYKHEESSCMRGQKHRKQAGSPNDRLSKQNSSQNTCTFQESRVTMAESSA